MLETFTFNGRSSDEFGIVIKGSPVTINRGARKFRSASVPGHNGNVYELQDAWEEVTRSYTIVAGDTTRGSAQDIYYQIAEWLHSANNYAVLTDTYEGDHYQMAVCVDALAVADKLAKYGETTVKFRCRPEHYIITDPVEVSSGGTITNATNHIALPKITLTGGGTRSLFKMSGRTMATLSTDPTTVADLSVFLPNMDTNVWMVLRQTVTTPNVYPVRFTGSSKGTITSLSEGELEYAFTDTYPLTYGVGFIINANPDTDYTLSWEGYKGGKVEIWCANATGYNTITAYYVKNKSSISGWVADSLTFHTPQYCGYLLVSLSHPTTLETSWKYRNVMLTTGTEAKPFRAYGTPSESAITVNDITLTMTASGIGTAVIDCEKENVTVDGANGNPISKVTDAYGNLSASYLRLAKGANEITFSGDITAVSVEPRFWTL